MLKIVSIELIVHYDIVDQSVEISQSTSDGSTFDIHLLDVDQDQHTGRTTLRLNNSKEMQEIMEDFNKRFNLIKNDNRNKRSNR